MVSNHEKADASVEASAQVASAPPKLSDSGRAAVQGPPDAEEAQTQKVDTSTPRVFGTFAHQGYEQAAYEQFDEVDNEVPVTIKKPDGTDGQGFIDTMIGDTLIDDKTNDMRDWDAAKAAQFGKEHGERMRAYLDSSGTPKDARGWIVATVGPRDEEIRQAYADTLAGYGVGVQFARTEDQDAVMEAVQAAVNDTTTRAGSDT